MGWNGFSDAQKEAHWRHSETELTAMTKWARAHLPGDAEQVPGGWTIEALLVEVEDLTDNREYGLALDILYALLDDFEVPVPRFEIDRMANLAKHMNLTDSIPDRFRPE